MVSKKKADEAPETVSLGLATRTLPVKLTGDELLEKGARLAQIEDDVTSEKARQLDHKETMKARLAALEAERSAVASSLRRGIEYRDVKVDQLADYELGKVREVRTDTGEVSFTRLLTDEERQRKLFADSQAHEAPA